MELILGRVRADLYVFLHGRVCFANHKQKLRNRPKRVPKKPMERAGFRGRLCRFVITNRRRGRHGIWSLKRYWNPSVASFKTPTNPEPSPGGQGFDEHGVGRDPVGVGRVGSFGLVIPGVRNRRCGSIRRSFDRKVLHH